MKSLLPPNSTALERAQEHACSLDHIDCPINTLTNPWTCPESVLPYLAWAFSVDFWDPAWPLETKRRVVANAWEAHAYKGTVHGLETALANLGHATMVAEWFSYGGDPAKFKIDIELKDRGLSEAEQNNILSVINYAKNVRSHLDVLNIWLTSNSTAPKVCVTACCGEVIEVLPHQISELNADNAVPTFGVSASTVEWITVLPQENA